MTTTITSINLIWDTTKIINQCQLFVEFDGKNLSTTIDSAEGSNKLPLLPLDTQFNVFITGKILTQERSAIDFRYSKTIRTKSLGNLFLHFAEYLSIFG